MTFKEKLVILRKSKGLTQDDFASAVGVSRQAVYKWESGQSYPEVPKLLEMKLLFTISIDELLDDIESIVYSGTKLNIDYFLEEILDEENMLEIYDYFKNSDTDNIDIAIDELGGEYSEEEIRLVRVKFISEMGN